MGVMKQEIEQAIAVAVKDVFGINVAVELTRPDEQFGDYATNVALQLSKQLGKNPREIAEQLAEKLRVHLGDTISDVQIAGPGFLNITLSDAALVDMATAKPLQPLVGQTVVVEYSDPSAFKVLHAGHFYTSVVGDTIANLFENAGATVHRVNFGGDVGRHVAITMWAILHELGGEHPEKLADVPQDQHADWMSARYVEGNTAFEENDDVKPEVIELNKRIYQVVNDNDHDSPFAQVYWTCRQWSYDYFDAFYARIGTKFEKYYPESITAPVGLRVVREQLSKGVYKESDGAVVFEGEPFGLHTRVFINSQGLPTYEAKDVGLITLKWNEYHYDRSIILTDYSQANYLEVVLKSVDQFASDAAERTTHIPHGMVKLRGAVKMSSRKGNIFRAVDVIESAKEANKKATGRDDEHAALGAVKYAFVKQRISPEDLIYDPDESVSLEGNSGPYLQYAHARARSILAKAGEQKSGGLNGLQPDERTLLRKITEYPEVVQKATNELMPHHICTYLYELAQVFNRFYEHNRVIGDEREAARVQLVQHYADTLKNGLGLLGIMAPDRM